MPVEESAQVHNIDPAPIAVFGESSGGGIAAGMASMARNRQLSPPLAKPILIYAMLDDHNITAIDGLEELAFWKSEDDVTS